MLFSPPSIPFSAVDVSKHLVNKLYEKNKKDKKYRLPTPMKINILLYFIQGFYMSENNKTSLFEEYFLAYKYGPVIYEVYKTYNFFQEVPNVMSYDVLNEKQNNLVDRVIDSFDHHSSSAMQEYIQQDHTAWSRIRRENHIHLTEDCSLIIPKRYMFEEFSQFELK